MFTDMNLIHNQKLNQFFEDSVLNFFIWMANSMGYFGIDFLKPFQIEKNSVGNVLWTPKSVPWIRPCPQNFKLTFSLPFKKFLKSIQNQSKDEQHVSRSWPITSYLLTHLNSATQKCLQSFYSLQSQENDSYLK